MKTNNPKTINSLYIHIPFCKHICFYCDFPKLLLNKTWAEQYLDALLIELKKQKINHKLKTIYIGGGTPTAIDLTRLLKALQPFLRKDTEFTIEGNLLDLTPSLLKTYKRYGVNRLSLGVQSTNNRILKILGRSHTRQDVFNKIKLAKSYIKNINLDLIYGFNELNKKDLKNELIDYLSLDVNHISTYSLEIHPNTKFYLDKRKEMDQSQAREQFDLIHQTLAKHGYIRYEISNFAKKGYESRHNLTYWKDEQYYGIGFGAASYIGNYRYRNTLNFKNYLARRFVAEKELVKKDDDKKYYLMLNLRLRTGVNLKDYQMRFDEDLLKSKKTAIKKLQFRNLLKVNYNSLVATYEGSMLLDIILRELF